MLAQLVVLPLILHLAGAAPWSDLVTDLQRLRNELNAKNVDTFVEGVTLDGVWPVMKTATAWDAANSDAIAKAWCLFDPKLPCQDMAASMTANETQGVTTVLNDAIETAKAVAANPSLRPARVVYPKFGAGVTSVSGNVSGSGWFVRRNTSSVVMLNGYVWAENGVPSTLALGVRVGGSFLSPQTYLANGPQPSAAAVQALTEMLVQQTGNASFQSAFLEGAKPLPAWTEQQYPGINDCVPPRCHAHFIGFDWFNPGALDVYTTLLESVIAGPAANASDQLGGTPIDAVLLVNEPGVTSVNSTCAQQAYTTFLNTAYDNNATKLNAAYGTHFASVSDVPVWPTPATPPSVSGGAFANLSSVQARNRYYDWQAWSQSAYRGFFHSLQAVITAAAARVPLLRDQVRTHLKVAANHIALASHPHGLDLVGLLADHAIAGTDSRAQPGSSYPVFPRPEPYTPGLYSGFYLSQMTYFPFVRSLAREKPLFDSETHGVSTVKARQAMPRGYGRLFDWLSTLQGRAMASNWFWGREKDGALSRRSPSGFPDSLLTQPTTMDEQGRAMWQLSAVGDRVAALVGSLRPVAVWYSRLSLISEPTAAASLVRAVEVASFLPTGAQVGFVAERLLQGRCLTHGALDGEAVACQASPSCLAQRAVEEAMSGAVRCVGGLRGIGAVPADAAVVVLPLAPYAHDTAVEALRAWLGADPNRRVVVVAENCTASPSVSRSCSLFRLREDGSLRNQADLAWLAGSQVTFVPIDVPEAMLPGVHKAVQSAGVASRGGCFTSEGAPVFGVLCWVVASNNHTSSSSSSFFALNLLDQAVTVEARIHGEPLQHARALAAEPPLGIDPTPTLPKMTLPRFGIAALSC